MPRVGSAARRVGHSPIFAPLVLGFAATLIAAAGSSVPGPWRDEEATLVAATRTWGELYEMARYQIDAVHAFYYALMHAWLAVVPPDLFWLRLPSAIAVGAAVAGAVVLGRLLVSTYAGVIAGIVLLTVPRVLWSAVEARSFALQIALGMWLLVAFVSALQGRGWRRWAVWGILSAASGALFLFLFLVPVSQVLAVSLSPAGRRHLRDALLALSASALVLAPLAWLAYRQRGQVAWIGQSERDVRELLRTATVEQWFGSGALFGALALVLLGAGAFALIAKPRPPVSIPPSVLAPVLALTIVVPTLALLATELTDTPLYVARYTVGSIGAVAMVIAIGLARLRPVVTATVLVTLALVAVPDFVAQRSADAKSDWADIARNVETLSMPGDAVFFAQHGLGDRLRGVMAFYPSTFAPLEDVGMGRPATEMRTLYESALPIESALDKVDSGQRLVVVGPHSSETADHVRATLLSAGFEEVDSVRSRRTTVALWVQPGDTGAEEDR